MKRSSLEKRVSKFMPKKFYEIDPWCSTLRQNKIERSVTDKHLQPGLKSAGDFECDTRVGSLEMVAYEKTLAYCYWACIIKLFNTTNFVLY
jgi:hypothetical protein